VESVTLTTQQLPSHQHSISASTTDASLTGPGGNLPAAGAEIGLYSVDPPNHQLGAAALASQGASQPHENRQPFLAITFIIALSGIFPRRIDGTPCLTNT
jgi:microcystin-dependent protein